MILLTWIVIAIFAFVIGVLFAPEVPPASVIPVNFEIVVALLIGWWIYKRRGTLWPSIVAVTALYVVVFICAAMPEWGVLPDGLQDRRLAIVTWIVFLLVYRYIASVLPVASLLQPRDYINSHQLFIGLGALLLGIVVIHPEVTAPAFNRPSIRWPIPSSRSSSSPSPAERSAASTAWSRAARPRSSSTACATPAPSATAACSGRAPSHSSP